jgi:hypothetical protein
MLLVAHAVFSTVVQPIGAAPQVLIPAAGSAGGANGTFFRSDITIVNLATHDQMVVLQWLPQGSSGADLPPVIISIPALMGIRSADFVHDYLNQAGVGSIVLTGAVDGRANDPTARLFVNARIWTSQSGSGGTTSQSFPAIPVSTINTPAAALFGLGADTPNYRMNVGIVNLDPTNAQTFTLSAPWPVVPQLPGVTVTVQPLSMQQVPMGRGAIPWPLSITNVTPAAKKSNLWIAYGSTIDNLTGSAWSELAVTIPE